MHTDLTAIRDTTPNTIIGIIESSPKRELFFCELTLNSQLLYLIFVLDMIKYMRKRFHDGGVYYEKLETI